MSVEQPPDTVDGPDIYEDDISSMPIATGDLFMPIPSPFGHDDAGVVLTPMCDLAQEKTPWIKFAWAQPFAQYLAEEFLPRELKGQKEYTADIERDPHRFGRDYLDHSDRQDDVKTLGLVRRLQQIMSNTNPPQPSRFYLPGKNDRRDGFLVDFSCIFSVAWTDLEPPLLSRRLKSPWREQLLTRYTSFSMRVGTADYRPETIRDTIQAFFPRLEPSKIENKMRWPS